MFGEKIVAPAYQTKGILHQRLNIQIGTNDFSACNPEFDLASADLPDHLACRAVVDAERDAGPLGRTIRDTLRHQAAGHRGDTRHHDASSVLFADIPQLPQRGIKFIDQAGSGSDQSLPDTRQLELTRRAVEKLQAQFVLELPHR